MNKRLAAILVILVIVLLCLLVSSLTYRVARIEESVNTIANAVKSYPKIISGKDGYTPVKGFDYTDGSNGRDGVNGRSGANGTNATSTDTVTTIYKEDQVPGPAGAPGTDAPALQIQIDPITGDLETKSSADTFWTTLIPCAKLQVSCTQEGL